MQVWQPEGLDLPGATLKTLSYVVVDEVVEEAARLSVSAWPRVDEAGRLRFAGDERPRSVRADLRQLRNFVKSNRADGGSRPSRLRMGIVLAVRVDKLVLPKPERNEEMREHVSSSLPPERVDGAACIRHHRSGARQGEGGLLCGGRPDGEGRKAGVSTALPQTNVPAELGEKLFPKEGKQAFLDRSSLRISSTSSSTSVTVTRSCSSSPPGRRTGPGERSSSMSPRQASFPAF